MKLKGKSTRPILAIFITVNVVALALASSGCGGGNKQTKTGSNGDTGTKRGNLEEAEAVVGFKIKVPKQKLGGKFEGYYTESGADGHQGIYLKYSSGYTFGAEKIGKVDYKADVAFERDVIFKESTIHPDSSFHVVYIAGHRGKACAPWHSGDEKGPPQLFWSDSGIEYDIVPYKLGFEEKQLIEVAESMYK